MATKKAVVKIEGLTALLMHRYPVEPIEAIEKKSPDQQAEIAAYRHTNGMLFVPGTAVQRALISGATYSKGKGRGSLARVAAACLFVTPEVLFLEPQNYTIDSRSVVNPPTGGRIMRHRPKLEKWSVTFMLEWDDALLSEVQARRIVDDTGSRVGVLDFRPERRGPFGRFIVTSWVVDENGSGKVEG